MAAAAAAATTTASVHDIVTELVKFKKDSVKKKNTENVYFVYDQIKLLQFINAKDISRERLELMSQQLRLTKTCTSRNKSGDRLGYGLSRHANKLLKEHSPPKTLFYFHLNKLNGLYNASGGNVNKLTHSTMS